MPDPIKKIYGLIGNLICNNCGKYLARVGIDMNISNPTMTYVCLSKKCEYYNIQLRLDMTLVKCTQLGS